MSEMGLILGRPKEAKTFAPDSRWVLPKCLIGLEFEYEMVDTSNYQHDQFLPTVWATHRDDSLKDHGVEFVFHQPLFGQDAYRAIQELMKHAKEEKWKCSLRAGIHVHLDARDMETSQLIGLIILYTILEPLIYRWISENRENSIFCVPFYRANDSLVESIALVKAILSDEKNNTKGAFQVAKQFARYAGLNLNALAKYGSVEFRHMKTTHDFDRVVDWINIIQSLKAATYKFPTSDGAILRAARDSQANAFLEYVFGNDLAKKIWRPDADHLIQTIGIPTARDLVLYGLTEMEWLDLQPPRGKHEGFEKYLKSPIKQLIKKTEIKLAKTNPDGDVPEDPPSLRPRNRPYRPYLSVDDAIAPAVAYAFGVNVNYNSFVPAATPQSPQPGAAMGAASIIPHLRNGDHVHIPQGVHNGQMAALGDIFAAWRDEEAYIDRNGRVWHGGQGPGSQARQVFEWEVLRGFTVN